MTDRNALIAPAAIALALPAIAHATMGLMPLLVFSFAFGGGFLVYVLTLWRRRIDARQILIPYLATVMLFVLHVWEEYLTGFEHVIEHLSARAVPQEAFLSVAAFIAPMLWIGGAIAILARWRVGDYMLVTFFFAMLFAELTHFLFPFLIAGHFHYQSGMWTAALPLIPAAWGIWLIARALSPSAADPAPPTASGAAH